MIHLPHAPTPEAWEALGRKDPRLAQAARSLAEHHLGPALPGSSLSAGGSLPVFLFGGRCVVKLYPPPYREEAVREAEVLGFLEGRLGEVSPPRLFAVGEQDGWGYVLMSRLPGRPLAELWPSLSTLERRRLARSLGEVTARLHQLDLSGFSLTQEAFEPFLVAQRARAVAHHRARGEPERFLSLLPAFLDAALATPAGPDVLLHTELMPDHLFVTGDPPRLSGLLDFEPAMIGQRDYELASVGLFVARGEPSVLGAFLEGYGASSSPELARRIFAQAVLHRYSKLDWYRQWMPKPADPDDPESLADAWFGA